MKFLIIFLSLAMFSSDYTCKIKCQSQLEQNSGVKEVSAYNKTDIFEYLEETKEDLEESIKDLSDEQMQYKPDEESWSVAEIVEHIIIVEGALKNMLESKIQAGESQGEEAKMSDEEVVGFITDRSSKIQTQDQFQPSGKFSSADEAIDEFDDQRESIVDWLKDSDVDMRKYVNEFPFGKIDAYQTILFMAGHTERHTAQIEEVKSGSGFPEE